MKVEYIDHCGDDLSPVNAARVSFDKVSSWETESSFPADWEGETKKLSEKDRKLIHYLAKHKHTSCFEHQTATLRLKVPIFIARQIQRHRTFAYNEISRRYVDNEPEFFTPDIWRGRAENVKQGSSEQEIVDAHAINTVVLGKALDGYHEMLRIGVAPEMARMILPQSMYTEFYMTGNLRNWSHFLHLRLDGHAQKEVQDVAAMVSDVLTPLFPISMEALLTNHD